MSGGIVGDLVFLSATIADIELLGGVTASVLVLNIDSARPTGLVNGMMVIDRFSSTLGGCPTRLVYISKRCKVGKVVGALWLRLWTGISESTQLG